MNDGPLRCFGVLFLSFFLTLPIDMSSPAERYQKARYDVLQHASTKHLVAQKEQSMENWAKAFALTQVKI